MSLKTSYSNGSLSGGRGLERPSTNRGFRWGTLLQVGIEPMAFGTGEGIDCFRVTLEVEPTVVPRVGHTSRKATLAQKLTKLVVSFR